MADKSDDTKSSSQDLSKQVKAWLETEGYPTEFRAASLFRRHGFHARQGQYVVNENEASKKEIDVIASTTAHLDAGFIRFSFVVECKWSIGKPWVIFSSPSNTMAPSAMIAQTISSQLGAAAIWVVAGNESLKALSTFSAPVRGGFGGRQAFSRGNDYFYSAVQSVVANSSSYASSYDRGSRKMGEMPECCVLVFPIIVVEGKIFEAYFNEKTNNMALEAVDHIRCHWDGSSAWDFFATVDVVSLHHLDEFLSIRARELKAITSILKSALEEIEMFRRSGSKEAINVSDGPRGFRGAPPLLSEFFSFRSSRRKLRRRVIDQSKS